MWKVVGRAKFADKKTTKIMAKCRDSALLVGGKKDTRGRKGSKPWVNAASM